MHRLQQHILSQLILHSESRYADLKPADVEGNLFMYHLKCLMKDGLVHKIEGGHYELTSEGKIYADQLSLKTYTPRAQPRIVTLLAVEDGEGQWLMYQRKRQPLINMIGFPYGKIHLGETVVQAAARELAEKTGMSADLHHIGDGYAITREEEVPVSQIMFHFFYGTHPRGELSSGTSAGKPVWMGQNELNGPNIIPNVTKFLDLIRKYSGQRFFVEFDDRV